MWGLRKFPKVEQGKGKPQQRTKNKQPDNPQGQFPSGGMDIINALKIIAVYSVGLNGVRPEQGRGWVVRNLRNEVSFFLWYTNTNSSQDKQPCGIRVITITLNTIKELATWNTVVRTDCPCLGDLTTQGGSQTDIGLTGNSCKHTVKAKYTVRKTLWYYKGFVFVGWVLKGKALGDKSFHKSMKKMIYRCSMAYNRCSIGLLQWVVTLPQWVVTLVKEKVV